ncbi:YgiQ family radical SAM protein [Planctomycetota bacterium]|nr:YgiQ family radical SAM protein [Planctomycetota bacterium]
MSDPADSHPLPMSRTEMRDWWGWDELDILLVNGDAYVDHPSFGIALIGRALVAAGFRTGIVAQPQCDEDFLLMGRPRLFAGVSAGNIDSMLNHYTAARKPRRQDHYSPGGKAGLRPDRATIVYTGTVKKLFKGLPVVIGGVEASLRRLAHWDHWSGTMRRSMLADSKADLLCYGMAEAQILEIAHRLKTGESIKEMTDIRGTCWMANNRSAISDPFARGQVDTPSYTEIKTDLRRFADGERIHFLEQDPARGRMVVQATDARFVVQNPPARPLGEVELDLIYAHPYTRREHPAYVAGVPALETVRTSIVTHRGCVANCNFCSIVYHQGKDIQNRSVDSVVAEAERIASQPGFTGTISDVGGPSANMFRMRCGKMRKFGSCVHRDCLLPTPCPSLESGVGENLDALRRIRALPGVKHTFIQSGIRYDLALRDGDEYIDEVARHHVSGIMKVAPEATDDRVLTLMNKPRFDVFRRFKQRFLLATKKAGKKQFITEYLIAGHPGCDTGTMAETAATLRREGMQPDQVQEFVPIPMTISTAMHVSGLDPFTMQPIATITGDRERRMQKALIHSGKPDNRKLVLEALQKTGRMDLADALLGDGTGGSGTKGSEFATRAKKGGYFGPTFMAGGGDSVVDEDEARIEDELDAHDGHFPDPRQPTTLACGTRVPTHLAQAAQRGGFNPSWQGKKKTSTVKPLRGKRR